MIRVHADSAAHAGSCNFCTNRSGIVCVMRSDHPGGALEVRLCPTCMSELRRVTGSWPGNWRRRRPRPAEVGDD